MFTNSLPKYEYLAPDAIDQIHETSLTVLEKYGIEFNHPDAVEILERAGIPCSPLHTLGALAAHPHSRASGMVYDYQHPQFGPMSAVAQPVRYEGERAGLRRAPPDLGEHSVEVLREAGFDDARIDSLAASGVIRFAGKT